MLGFLFILFVTIPLAEIYLLLAAGAAIGGANTFALVILSAMVGSWLVREQGLATLAKIQQQLGAGQAPGEALVDGVFIAASGLLLLTPGFITDGLGLVFLIPPIRRLIAGALRDRLSASVQTEMHFGGPGGFGEGASFPSSGAAFGGPGGMPFGGAGGMPFPGAPEEVSRGSVSIEPSPGEEPSGPSQMPETGPEEIIIEAKSVRYSEPDEQERG